MPSASSRGKGLRDARGRKRHRADCIHLHRWPLGTPYPAIVAAVKDLAGRPELAPPAGGRRPALAIDATGVGRAVVDLFLAAGLPLRPVPITITAGEGHRFDPWPGSRGAFWVAKRELVGVVQAGLQTGGLKVVPALPLAEVLRTELLGFQIKISAAANEQFGAWREGTHDDLVLAVALAAWLGEHDVGEQVVYRWGERTAAG